MPDISRKRVIYLIMKKVEVNQKLVLFEHCTKQLMNLVSPLCGHSVFMSRMKMDVDVQM